MSSKTLPSSGTSPSARTIGSLKGKPSTPHPQTPHKLGVSGSASLESFGMAFDFAGVEHSRQPDDVPSESCVGISLATFMDTFRPLPKSPLSMREDDGSIFHRICRFHSIVQKTLTCTGSGRTSCRSSTCRSNDSILYTNAPINTNSLRDDHYLCDGRGSLEEFEGEKGLMQRAASWGTQETENDPSSAERKPNVQFHYPPITSVRLRPRTQSNEIKQLFFAPEELEEIEDDRSATRAADDIETLAVGADNWNTLPHNASSIVTASDCDDQESSRLLLAGGASNLMSFPPKRDGTVCGRRYVRGVQIMLREKST